MGNDITAGVDFSDGETLTAARLDNHVNNAVIKATFISTKTLKDTLSLSENFVIEDSGQLKRTTTQQIIDAVPNQFPVGAVVDYAGTVSPTGWLLCYGQEIDRETYSDLFASIGTTWGAGNGSSTFNVPDLRGRTSSGVDAMGGVDAGRLGSIIAGTLGSVGGAETHALDTPELPAHNHVAYTSTYAPMHIQTAEGAAQGLVYNANGYHGRCWINSGYETACYSITNIAATGSNGVHNNMQPTACMNKIIKI